MVFLDFLICQPSNGRGYSWDLEDQLKRVFLCFNTLYLDEKQCGDKSFAQI